jgi:hypothetical protein
VTKTISSSVVDAFISIRPNATNAVGQPHTFTVTLWKQVVTPATTLAAAASAGDTNVKVTSVSGFAAGQTLRVGTELVAITSVGTAGAGGTGISFAPALASPHASGAGALGYVPAADEHVDYTLTNANGANAMVNSAATTCGVAGADTDANGQCVIVFTSPTAGEVIGSATSTLTVAGVPVTRSTGDSYVLDSPNAIKTFVDARISITPAFGTNAVGQTHVFTAHVDVNPGTGFVSAPVGTLITFSIGAGGVGTLSPTSCTTVGTTGSCSVNDNSTTAGIDVVTASTSVTIHGTYSDVTLTRSTDTTHGSSGPGNKLWIHTDVHNSAHQVITTIAAPATVHDNFQAAPGVVGSVTFTLYDTADCSGSPDAANPPQTVPLTLASNGVVESTPITLNPPATQAYSFQAHYTADPSSPYPSKDAGCEPFTVTFTPTGTGNFTPGYWKNHETATTKLLSLTLGNYTVDTFAKAKAILSGMGCGSVGVENCMAGMLLATELNLAQGGAKLPCALTAVSNANALLVKYHYNGAGSTPSPALTSADAATMMTLHDQLSNYSQDGVPTSC